MAGIQMWDELVVWYEFCGYAGNECGISDESKKNGFIT